MKVVGVEQWLITGINASVREVFTTPVHQWIDEITSATCPKTDGALLFLFL
jgi:hypothetical protein